MKRMKVNSSSLASVGYDVRTHTLQIEFKTGTIYEYYDVPKSVYADLMKAPSLGAYFNIHVKDGGYEYSQTR